MGGFGGGSRADWSNQRPDRFEKNFYDQDKMSGLGGGLRPIDWSSQKLERFEKNFYVEDKRVSTLSDREVEDFRRSKEIRVSRPL